MFRTPGLASAILSKYGKQKSAESHSPPDGSPESSDEYTPKHAAMMQLMHAVHSSDVNKAVYAMNNYMSHHEGTGDEDPDADDDYDGDE